ncbi:MAG: hypothetical protein AAGM38_03805 [Pseudomonadota bacterium]
MTEPIDTARNGVLQIASPLALTTAPSDAPSAAGAAALRISEARPSALWQLAGWEDFEAAAHPPLAALGFTDSGDYRRARQSGAIGLFRLAPDRLWLTADGPQADAAIEEACAGAAGPALAVLNLSHSRTRIAVEGDDAEALLARLAPIDFSPGAFPIEGFAQTGAHHISVLIHRPQEARFEILTPVTWARSLWEAICAAATPFGYETRREPAVKDMPV